MKISKIFSKYAIYFVLVLLIIVFSIASSSFLLTGNLFNILRQVAVTGITAVGMTFVILSGGIDLSVGSVIGVTGVITAQIMLHNVNPVLAAILGIAVATCLGLLNGIIVTKFKVHPMIETLGMLTALRGVAYLLTGGLPVYGFPASFTILGQGNLGLIPNSVILMAIVFVIGYIVLNKSVIGRHIYGAGGNEEATRLSGINVTSLRLKIYAISGLLAGLAGIVLLSRTNSAQPIAGTGYEMDVITAVVLGGVSITGGEGKISRVVAGVLIMGILSNGMILLNIGDYVQKVVQGLVLIAAVAFDVYNRNKKSPVVIEEQKAE